MNAILKTIYCILSIIISLQVIAQKPSNNIDILLHAWQKDTTLSHASWSFKAINLSSNKIISEYCAEKSLIPASVMKMVTVGTMFISNKSSSSFATELLYTGSITRDSLLRGNIIIRGKGDPTLGSPRFKTQAPSVIFPLWANAIRELGIKSIDGKIITESQCVQDEPYPDGWTWGDIGNYYGAGFYGINYLDNEFKIVFAPSQKVGEQAEIMNTIPEIPNIQFTNSVTIADSNSSDSAIIYPAFDKNHYHISGTIPLQKSEFSVRSALLNPSDILVQQFSDFLYRSGFLINNAVYNVPIDYKPVLFFTHNPVTFQQVAKLTMQNSVNLYAEAILHSFNFNKSRKENINSIREILNKQGILTTGTQMTDGSGMSRNNLLSSEFLCDFLQNMFSSPSFKDFYDTFSVAGVSGTLSGMCKNTTARNNLRAKSGSMNGVLAYAGYVNNKNGDMICFALIINNFEGKQSALKKKIESLFTILSE